VISVLAHAALMRMAPPLPIGRPPELRDRPRRASIAMQDVEREARERVERPPPFQQEDAGQFADLELPPDAWARELEAIVPETPELDLGSLSGETAPLAEPPPPEPTAAWEPRQDILQIEDALFAEEISVLPRRLTPSVPRAPDAPDVTLPIDWSAADAADAPQPASGPGAGDRRGEALSSVAPLPSPLEPAIPEEPPTEIARVEEPSRLLDETLEDVTDIEPIEQLLALNVSVQEPMPGEEFVYFKIELQRRAGEALPVVPKDVLLIQDASQSMTYHKLEECKAGLRQWLDRLNPGDRFDIMGFRDEPYRCFGKWTRLTPATRRAAERFIEGMSSRGRTDVYASLRAVLEIEQQAGRPVIAVLVTDGRPTEGLADSSDIIESFSQRNDDVAMFAFGGGHGVNRFLLDFLSYKNRGDALVVKRQRDIPQALAVWAEQLRRPVLTSLRYRFAGLDQSEIYPRTLTHLFLDRPLVIYGRARGRPDTVAFQIVGYSGSNRHDMVFTIDWRAAQRPEEDLRGAWAQRKIFHLISEHLRTQNPEIIDQLYAMEAQYGIAVPYREQYLRR